MRMMWGCAAALALACPIAAPARAATCDLTVQGARVIDGAPCTATVVRGGTRVAVEGGDLLTVRGSVLRARFAPRPGARAASRAYGRVIASSEGDEKTCYFNQRATLCVDP